MFNLKIKKNKNMKNYFILVLFSIGIFFLSCEKEDDCHECHIAYINSLQVEIEGEIGEYCDDALANVEANGYDLLNDIIVGNDTIPAGFYPGSEIHCDPHLHD